MILTVYRVKYNICYLQYCIDIGFRVPLNLFRASWCILFALNKCVWRTCLLPKIFKLHFPDCTIPLLLRCSPDVTPIPRLELIFSAGAIDTFVVCLSYTQLTQCSVAQMTTFSTSIPGSLFSDLHIRGPRSRHTLLRIGYCEKYNNSTDFQIRCDG